MKNFISVVFICFSVGVSAQIWAPFPLDPTSKWRENFSSVSSDGCLDTYQYDYYVAGTDSFEGHQYFRMEYTGVYKQSSGQMPCSMSSNTVSGVGGFIRQENGVYYTWGPGEEVWFDFNVAIGDTVREGLVVDSITTVDVAGTPCRKAHLRDEWDEPHWIIEGVGHSGGLFNSIYQEFTSGSLCYQENDIPLVYTHQNSCDLLNSIDGLDEVQVDISPNPSTGIFNLSLQKQFSYRVFDLYGKLMAEGRSSVQSVIDLTSKPNGIYLLEADTEEGRFLQRLVKQ